MTIEEIKTEMNQLKSRVEQLGRELQMAETERKSAEVPETLDWEEGDVYYYLASYGIDYDEYADAYNYYAAQNHTIFKTEEFAEIFREKTQFIADLLHFKWLYDRDYEPDWNNKNSDKWYIFYDNCLCGYVVSYANTLMNPETVYFSSEEIAQKCADWLNSRNARNKND